ncbi:flagellar basal body P-ring formation chaperone FlgA [Roseovarius rhodophyticola]|uniref:Flagella basal body P-ring formation protein FlgA n=1 Tax=Roseovarius rhodophyticola TaxID=3080827 RepID=A0ABZ2TKP9_9RHOB|nr:flagellar basal body P-ring formation chaperone FlgA [Roseovarius sp. W115]MDV2929991.1 flagellar basal body P-ring formation chaperone FlgA [Roseovarius sp. W115]
MRFLRTLTLVTLTLATPASADTIVAAHTIRPMTVLSERDLDYIEKDVPGGVADPERLVGQEARVALYAGRPIREADVQAPAVIERNQVVELIYETNGLRIATEGRSLDRAGLGELVRVMNLSSRSTVSGRVSKSGQVIVSK